MLLGVFRLFACGFATLQVCPVVRSTWTASASDESHLNQGKGSNVHSLLESCGPLRVVRMSMKVDTSMPLVFSPASNRVCRNMGIMHHYRLIMSLQDI